MKPNELNIGDMVRLPNWAGASYKVAKIEGSNVWIEYEGTNYLYSYRDWVRVKKASKSDPAPAPVVPAPKKRPHGKQEYKGNGKHTWEHVDGCHPSGITDRLRVPGGWLYRVDTHMQPPAITFVPVPQAVGYAV